MWSYNWNHRAQSISLPPKEPYEFALRAEFKMKAPLKSGEHRRHDSLHRKKKFSIR
jgi:hypothetical protein